MRRAATLLLAALLRPGRASACAVCFNPGENIDVAKAYTWGIFILLAFTVAILGGLALAVYNIEKSRAASGRGAA